MNLLPRLTVELQIHRNGTNKQAISGEVNNGCRRDQGVKVVWTLGEMVARSGNEIQLTELGV